MPYVVNVAISDTFILRDNANAAITGKTSADFATVEAYQISDPTTTAPITLTDLGSGRYRISFTPTTAADWTAHLVYNAGGVFREYEPNQPYDVLPAAADPAAIADALAAVQATVLGSEVTVTSPLATDGTIMLLQGDTYDSDETRAIVFSLTGQPNLTSATATLLLSWGVDSLAVTGVITNAGQTTQTITVELTAAQTATLPVTGITYALKATLANAHVVTMQTGRVIVSAALPAN